MLICAMLHMDIHGFLNVIWVIVIAFRNRSSLCMLEYRVEMILCNRGASLKDKLINEQMIFQQRNEKLKLEMIKMKASKIKEEYFRQQRFCGENCFTPTSYYEAIRSGDYYMFAGEPVADDFVETEYEVFPEVDPGCTGSHEGINLILANQSKSLQNIHTTEEAVDAEGVLKTAISIQAANVEGNFLLNKLKTMSLELAVTLNNFTKEYRYIAHALKSEKKLLKTNLRAELYDCARSLKSIRDAWELNKTDQNIELEDLVVVKKDYYIRWNERNTFSRLFSAVRFFLRSNTDILCYMLAFCATASCGSVAIPLGLMVLLWGSLTPLRPSKKFWIAMILYTQALIILKFFLIATQVLELNFENEKIDITSDSVTWLQLSGLIKPRSLWDVLLLISLFFHRYNLRRLGLWKEKKIYIQTAFAAPDESYEFDVESSQLMGNITKKPKARSFIEKSFSNLFNPKYRVIKDLYPWMFFVDVISFFIVVFGYKYFGDGSTGNIINDISENRVPITFVIMVIAMSFMFVIDRALYLQKSKVGKFIYHLMTIFFIHLWLFFLLPTITLISPNLNKACFLLYLTKGIYLLISAWTIRNGYPNLCSGNLFTHNYNLFNKISFKIFCNIPFLFEIRNTIDWTFTDTSMPLFHYFDLENYKAIFYDLKCERLEEQKQGKPRGVAIKAFSKYMMGLPMVIILILLIWIPLLAFAMVNTIGISVPLEKVEMTINVEGYPSLYQMEVQGVDITNLQMNEYNNFLANVPNIKHSMKPQKFLSRVKRAVSFIKSFSPHDIYRISFRPESENYWLISNHSKNALYSKLLLKERVKIEVDFKVIRERSSSKNEPQQHTTVFSYELKENTTARTALANALKNTDSDSSDVILQSIMPFFITIPIAGEVSPTNQILQLFANDYDISKAFMNLSLAKHNDKNHFSTWSIKTFSNLYNLTDSSYTSRTNNGQHIQMIAFVDRIYPSFINSYLSGGLLAMYVGLVLVIHKAIRSFLTHQPLDVMISQIPNPDYLLKICHDIYLVREVKNFELEQDLFSKFLFLLRSPATLIQWTRHKIKMD
uniref:Piezo_RRas_bdg domain-containing protein n=1 Tax=Rhabditophanes sp. KR3021 TaxID=114890 RepID=A0AC35U2K4_9BILA